MMQGCTETPCPGSDTSLVAHLPPLSSLIQGNQTEIKLFLLTLVSFTFTINAEDEQEWV